MNISNDVLINVFSFLPLHELLHCSYVSSTWYACIVLTREQDIVELIATGIISNSYHHLTNNLWKQFTLKRWPTFSSENNVSDWSKVYKRRHKAYNNSNDFFHKSTLIDACPEMEFYCPISWDHFSHTAIPNEMFCSQCKKPVYNVDTLEELAEHAKKGDCVAFKAQTEKIEIVKGMPRRREANPQTSEKCVVQ